MSEHIEVGNVCVTCDALWPCRDVLLDQNEVYRKALEEVHRYGLNVATAAEAYGEQESAHLWNEIAAIAEGALWPIRAASPRAGDGGAEGVGG